MADPVKYSPSFSFSSFQASNSSSPLPGPQVDIQFADLKLTTDQIIDALKQVRRSDGKLANKTVGPDQLSDALVLGFTLRGNWVQEDRYYAGDGVVYGTSFYKALSTHVATAGNRPDLSPVTWQFLLSFSTIAVADNSLTPAKLVSGQEAGFLAKIGAPSVADLAQTETDLEAEIQQSEDDIKGGVSVDYDTLAKLASALIAGLAGAAKDSKKPTRRNLWVNGSFKDSQENGNTLGTTNGYYPADQIALFFVASAAAMSVQRVQARTLANALDQIEFKTTIAKASLAAGDYVTLPQNIEGSSFVESGFGTANAKPYVHRFQVTLPAGLYHWHFQNAAGNRHCSVPFTIAGGEANTPVLKEVILPPDTTGTWLTADGVIGLTSELVLAVGATRTGGSASTWSASPYFAASTQFNILSSTANLARLADVGLKIDSDVTGAFGAYKIGEVDAVYRSERYWWGGIAGSGYGLALTGSAQTARRGNLIFPVKMCKTPAVSATPSSGTFSPSVSVDGVRLEVETGNVTAPVTVTNLVANARLS